jgi:hypothetical protein
MRGRFFLQRKCYYGYRVNLTPAQKRQRGSLTSCVLGGDLGVCCSTAQAKTQLVREPLCLFCAGVRLTL